MGLRRNQRGRGTLLDEEAPYDVGLFQGSQDYDSFNENSLYSGAPATDGLYSGVDSGATGMLASATLGRGGRGDQKSPAQLEYEKQQRAQEAADAAAAAESEDLLGEFQGRRGRGYAFRRGATPGSLLGARGGLSPQ